MASAAETSTPQPCAAMNTLVRPNRLRSISPHRGCNEREIQECLPEFWLKSFLHKLPDAVHHGVRVGDAQRHEVGLLQGAQWAADINTTSVFWLLGGGTDVHQKKER